MIRCRTYAKLQLLMRSVTYLEVRDGTEQIQRRIRNLGTVPRAVTKRHTAHHHVRITDSLHLKCSEQR